MEAIHSASSILPHLAPCGLVRKRQEMRIRLNFRLTRRRRGIVRIVAIQLCFPRHEEFNIIVDMFLAGDEWTLARNGSRRP